MRLTYYGHSCFLLETQGKKVIFDPFISPNDLAKEVDVDAIECDHIILTHGHSDHVADVERIASNNPDVNIISNFEIVNHFGNKNIDGHGMNHGGKWAFDFGTLKMVNAVHSSSLPDGSYGGNPSGIVIWNDEGCIYHAGDTALTRDMELITMMCPALTVAILPIGDNFTMDYKDARVASDMVDCDNIIACHFDTFPPIKVNHKEVIDHFTESGKNIILPKVGQTIDL